MDEDYRDAIIDINIIISSLIILMSMDAIGDESDEERYEAACRLGYIGTIQTYSFEPIRGDRAARNTAVNTLQSDHVDGRSICRNGT